MNGKGLGGDKILFTVKEEEASKGGRSSRRRQKH